ncbi:DUF5067 domain-containing protein [Anaerococcus hydrogenalis]|uniref:Putative lipoprotein n=1 Tax=Anaerococcus hydrogenalis ACS-025-V-Sch4 TaxID=879306 RepID=F0H2G5_9FIRM|nr:DUF5067 domain-containing protein [Anaerococcus hydrogenalis]EGC83427.1 putative lipoprotein [Anaerococcus hydrogenalis ACS-025-V-Sch4]MBS5988866.1 DUF5067 domain-containing protein [Anaerococcus hydrogenalis]
MKLNKILIAALSVSLLVGCQDKNTDTKTETPSSVQETSNVEKSTTASNENEKANQVKNVIPTQVIQQSPGETQKENYITLQNSAIQYQQTGDAFLLDSEINDGTKVLAIPCKFTNKDSDTPINPEDPMMVLTKAIQEDGGVNHEIFLTVGASNDYKNDLNTTVNKGGEIDYTLFYELKNPSLGLKIIDKKSGTVVAEFKPE